MKKLLLAALATAAISLPVMAQNAPQSGNEQQNAPPPAASSSQPSGGMNQQGQNSSQQDVNQQASNQQIQPSSLSKDQIRQLQLGLNKQGFHSGKADGIWGPETDSAVKNFQQAKNLPGSGHLNQQTLQQLGVNVTAQGQTGQSQGASTTGQGGHNQGMQNNEPSASPSSTQQPSSTENGSQPSGGMQNGREPSQMQHGNQQKQQ